MGIIKLAKSFSIDAVEYASQGNAILGIRDSGKTYTATLMAERLMDNNIPFIAFDPIGVWRYLKVGRKGKKGYPIVVAGDNGDLPLTALSAPDIVRSAMKENISLVLDLYSMSLSKNDWKKIVEQCTRLLLYENKNHGLRHIFIEEASEFCPQRVRPDEGRVYAEIEKLARMGGNASLGYTLINQRAEEVNKAVLELCDCLFLHRQKGRNSLTALGKWLDIADAKGSKQIIQSLPSLEQGECWAWSQGSHEPKLIRVPEKQSVHPDRRNPLITTKGVTADVSKFVAKLKKSLDVPKAIKFPITPVPRQTYKGHHIEQLYQLNEEKNKRISELNKQLMGKKYDAVKEKEIADLKTQLKDAQHRITMHEKWGKEALTVIKKFGLSVADHAKTLEAKCPIPYVLPQKTIRDVMHSQPYKSSTPISVRIENKFEHNERVIVTELDGSLGKCERALLTVLAQREGKPSNKSQLSLLSDYRKSSSGFKNSLSRLRKAEFMTGSGDALYVTESGKSVLGHYPPIPSDADGLQKYWMENLGKCESEILSLLIEHYPNYLSFDDINEHTGYSLISSGFKNGISKLNILELVVKNQKSLRASETLFP